MQAIAAEFNLAETTFVLPPKDPAHTRRGPDIHAAQRDAVCRSSQCRHRLRAGPRRHLLRPDRRRRPRHLRGKSRSGPDRDSEGWHDGRGRETRLRRNRFRSAPRLRANSWHRPAEFRSTDIETANHRPCIASCGAPFILAELKSRAALAAASPNGDVFRLEVAKHPAVSIMLYTQVDEADIDIRARMFAPHLNIPEDPATGSANVALIGLLAKLRPEANLSLSKTIAQGVEMGRPSILQANGGKAERRRHRDLHRRPLRACDVRNDRSDLKIKTLPGRDRRSSRDPLRS